MKKIILSLAMIVAVAAVAASATTAYFSDTETSTGNTFTAGAIDLTVSSVGSAVGASCQFANNTQVSNEAIITCSDVKPGDSGETTVKFNLASNEAWGCIRVNNIVDSDNTCTEPEQAAENGNCSETGNNNGELDSHLNVTVWVDDGAGSTSGGVACDNQRNGTEQVLVTDQPLSTFLAQTPTGASYILPVSDSSQVSMMHAPLQPGDHCIGIEWRVPGETTGNDVQTDKIGGDLEFYVEQHRNNPNFVCRHS